MKIPVLFFLLLVSTFTSGQTDTTVYKLYKDRQLLEYRLNRDIINKKLSLPLNDSTEDSWDDTFFALQYLNRKDPWVAGRIRLAVTDLHRRSYGFARALLELLYGQYPNEFRKEILAYLPSISDAKVWTMAAEYLLRKASKEEGRKLERQAHSMLKQNPNNPFYLSFLQNFEDKLKDTIHYHDLFSKDYLPGNVLMISIQRTNRDYPGIVVIRDSSGNFLKNSTGKIFFVPQLARSLSGLPGYLTNGNTPSGILRMDGFDVSKAGAIGPTQNVQLTLPLEFNSLHFLRDSSLTDTILKIDAYRNLLPKNLRNSGSMMEAFYAGMAGRHEIIAHGTTVKPEYYSGKPYFPFTPTLGCLCTNEIWSDLNHLRVSSDQQSLVDAIKRAGGATGYAIVFNINRREAPVTIEEVLELMRKAGNE